MCCREVWQGWASVADMSRTASPPTRGTPSPGRGKPRASDARSRTGARASGTARPVGKPHGTNEATFRRRRLMVLVVVLVLVTGVVIGVRSAVAAVGDAIGAAEEPLPRTLGEPIAQGGGDQGGPPTAYELANPVACRPDALEIGVALSSASVKKGATTQVPVTVTNAGQVPCLLQVGTAQVVLTIYSGDDKIWDSRHCGGGGDQRLLLDIGAADETMFTWHGVRSNADCPAKPASAKPGTYRVIATLLDADAERIARDEKTFTIT
jgi:hypothetical protein